MKKFWNLFLLLTKTNVFYKIKKIIKDLIIYQSNENISVEVLYDSEDFWLTQKSMAKLFDVEVNTINYHLKEIFETREYVINVKEDKHYTI